MLEDVLYYESEVHDEEDLMEMAKRSTILMHYPYHNTDRIHLSLDVFLYFFHNNFSPIEQVFLYLMNHEIFVI
jgi:hypothetical protein